jgi:hypothetical protein
MNLAGCEKPPATRGLVGNLKTGVRTVPWLGPHPDPALAITADLLEAARASIAESVREKVTLVTEIGAMQE